MELKGYTSDSVADDLPAKALPKFRFCAYCGIYLNSAIRTKDSITASISRPCCKLCKITKGDKTLREYLWWLLEQLSKKSSSRGSGKWLNKIGNVSKLLAELKM